MLLITGTGRSGTGMLARVFGGHHEYRVPYLQEKYLNHGERARRNPFARMEDRLAAVLDLHQGIDPETFIDASNLYTYLIDALWALYPGVRFILGVRSAREFVLSAMARGWHERKPEELLIFPGDAGFEQWSGTDPVTRLGWLWGYRNGNALQALEELPSECWTIARIEALDPPELERLARHAGVLPADPGAVQRGINKGPNLGTGRTPTLTHKQEDDLNRLTEPLMKRLGYDQPPVDQTRVSQFR